VPYHQANIGWGRGLFETMSLFTGGLAYVSYLSHDDTARVRAAYGPEKYDRLVAVKKTYDPTNLFRLNQNIQPTL
jgi:FAD/FMN-containing dehydrogenase